VRERDARRPAHNFFDCRSPGVPRGFVGFRPPALHRCPSPKARGPPIARAAYHRSAARDLRPQPKPGRGRIGFKRTCRARLVVAGGRDRPNRSALPASRRPLTPGTMDGQALRPAPKVARGEGPPNLRRGSASPSRTGPVRTRPLPRTRSDPVLKDYVQPVKNKTGTSSRVVTELVTRIGCSRVRPPKMRNPETSGLR
jgi:hypothetical protein